VPAGHAIARADLFGGRHRIEERLGVADHASAEIAARDDEPAVIVSALHRIRSEPSRVGVPLERGERLVADDRLRDRDSRRADRKLEHGASLAISCCRQRHGRG
jgi:hypothetical protein